MAIQRNPTRPNLIMDIGGSLYNPGGFANPISDQWKTPVAGQIQYNNRYYTPYGGTLGGNQNTTPAQYTPNAFTQSQIAQFNNGQRGDFENNPAYQQYVAKMNNMYGVSPVGAAGDVLAGQTAFPAGGKTGPATTGGSNV